MRISDWSSDVCSSDLDGTSVVPGLMSLGEASCVSVHGANRLGSNSLLDLVVFGRAAANRCAEVVDRDSRPRPLPKDAGDQALARLDRFRHAKGGTRTASLRLEMQRIMQNNCAVFRTGEVLEEGAGMMKDAWQKRDDVGVSDRSLIWNSDLVETPELENLLYQAMVTIDTDGNLKESRGVPARVRTT